MKTTTIEINNVKDSDGYFEAGHDLGFSQEEIYKIFEWGEYGSFKIIVDENLNIVGGYVIPNESEWRDK